MIWWISALWLTFASEREILCVTNAEIICYIMETEADI